MRAHVRSGGLLSKGKAAACRINGRSGFTLYAALGVPSLAKESCCARSCIESSRLPGPPAKLAHMSTRMAAPLGCMQQNAERCACNSLPVQIYCLANKVQALLGLLLRSPGQQVRQEDWHQQVLEICSVKTGVHAVVRGKA